MKMFQLSDLYELSGLHTISGLQCSFSVRDVIEHFCRYAILPPRTAHIGDWNAFSKYSGTPLDFNSIIMERKLGYPLLVGSTRVENISSGTGDLVYRPGSIWRSGKPHSLALKNFDGKTWNTWSPSSYVPVTLVEEGGTVSTLVDYHRKRSDSVLLTEAEILCQHQKAVTELVISLLEQAKKEPNPRRLTSMVFSHWMQPSGDLEPLKDREITKEDIEYAFALLRCQLDTRLLVEEFFQVNRAIPVFSGLFIFMIEALLQVDRKVFDSSVTVHFHWGARRMAGIPPHSVGYFFSDSVQRNLKALFQLIQKVRPEFKSLTLVILPAPIFLLLPLKEDNLARDRYWSRLSRNSFYDCDNIDEAGSEWTEEFESEAIGRLTAKIGDDFAVAAKMKELA